VLEVWKAEWLEQEIGAGRTQPLAIGCIRTSSETPRERRVMIVKAQGLPEITESKLFNEVFGNLLAQELGVATPTPALVEISPLFLVVSRHGLSGKRQHLQSGLAVGTERLEGLMPVPPGAHLSKDELAQAALIYGFDLLVQNPDRRIDNSNCAKQGDRLVAFDFEMSFSFLLAIVQEGEPWEVSKQSICRNHIFRAALQRASEVNWRPFIGRLRSCQ
jgi:hypothetical protein